MNQHTRSRETARKTGGVLVAPGHWAAQQVHAFHQWNDEKTLTTWCGVTVDLAVGGAQTTDTITCQACPQASLQAFRGAP